MKDQKIMAWVLLTIVVGWCGWLTLRVDAYEGKNVTTHEDLAKELNEKQLIVIGYLADIRERVARIEEKIK